MPRRLTSTSYAVLGLLAIRSWTAYELTKQMRRSMGYYWPRAVSAVYSEPKNLVAAGLATSRVENQRDRRRTRYSITPEGRRALEAWLTQPSAPPQFESEAHLRVTFGAHAAKDDMLRTLQRLTIWAEELRATTLDIMRQNAVEDGPFPDRAHLSAIVGTWNLEYCNLLRSWAVWAEAEVTTWPSVDAAMASHGRELIRARLAAEERASRRRDGQ